MERIYAFLPSVLVIAGIAVATFLYMRWAIKRFGDNFKSVEWQEKNQWKVVWTVGIPRDNILSPALEELIFRAPLIIAFGAMSPFAWHGGVGVKRTLRANALARKENYHVGDFFCAKEQPT